jgi:hypothetical protein
MKPDFVTISIVIGITILLIDIFFEEYMFGLNTPILLLALGLILFAFFKQVRHEKKNK